MPELYEEFPSLYNNMIAIKKITDSDAKALLEISNCHAVYRYAPLFYSARVLTFCRQL